MCGTSRSFLGEAHAKGLCAEERVSTVIRWIVRMKCSIDENEFDFHFLTRFKHFLTRASNQLNHLMLLNTTISYLFSGEHHKTSTGENTRTHATPPTSETFSGMKRPHEGSGVSVPSCSKIPSHLRIPNSSGEAALPLPEEIWQQVLPHLDFQVCTYICSTWRGCSGPRKQTKPNPKSEPYITIQDIT